MHTVNFKTFALRRIARLYPLYIVSIIFFLSVNTYIIAPSYSVKIIDFGMGPAFAWHVFLQLLMLGSLSEVAQPNGPIWSVSVEWMVNLAYFAVIWRYQRIPNLVLWVMLLLSTWCLMHISPHILQAQSGGIAILRGIVGFTVGSVLFRYHRNLPEYTPRALHLMEKMLFVFAVLLAYFHDDLLEYGVDYGFQLVLFPALIMISLYRQGWICRIFSLPPITFLGRISYSIYLLHYPLAYAVAYMPRMYVINAYWLGIFYIFALIGLSTLSYKYIEKPGRRMGRVKETRSKPRN